MISVGSLLRFKNNHAPWETAVVLRSYVCEKEECCFDACLTDLRTRGLVDNYFRVAQVVDILWNNGQIDEDYHLEGLTSDQVEVIPQ